MTDIHINDNNSILVGFMIKMAHEMGAKICAEGVETIEELDKIKILGADYIQGYYFGKPVPANIFEEKNLEGRLGE